MKGKILIKFLSSPRSGQPVRLETPALKFPCRFWHCSLPPANLIMPRAADSAYPD